MPDRSQWSLMGGTSAVGSPATLSGDSMVAWGQSTLEGAPTALLGQQVSGAISTSPVDAHPKRPTKL